MTSQLHKIGENCTFFQKLRVFTDSKSEKNSKYTVTIEQLTLFLRFMEPKHL